MNAFIQQVREGNVAVLNINLDKNGLLVAALQKELQNNYQDDSALDRYVEGAQLHDGRWTRFNVLVSGFLRYCRDVNPWSLWESSDLLFTCYQDLGNCLLQDSYPIEGLVRLFKEETEWIVPRAVRLDSNRKLVGTKKHLFVQHVASVISKVFNSIKGRVDEASSAYAALPAKQQILLYVANQLNNIYFRIDSPSSCANIFKNIQPKSMIEHFQQYPIKEQVEYRYLLGRYYLSSYRISDAFAQLRRAFQDLCALARAANAPVPALQRNMVRVLRYLVPAGIILGRPPPFALLESLAPTLGRSYGELVHALKTGNLQAMHQWLRSHEDELRRRRLLLLLLEKLPLLAYRNLLRRAFQIVALPAYSNRIPYAAVETALRLSIGTPDPAAPPIYRLIHTPDNAENVLVSLINYSFLRGNCFPLNRMCVTMKTTNLPDVFPAVTPKIASKFPQNHDDAWLDS
ncbi:AaceriAER203Cp [[Ashbya] aceris (nom. inval.)]|nr:AaceriAER203Cp [[Ashbya] aceris (nom. inval.)]